MELSIEATQKLCIAIDRLEGNEVNRRRLLESLRALAEIAKQERLPLTESTLELVQKTAESAEVALQSGKSLLTMIRGEENVPGILKRRLRAIIRQRERSYAEFLEISKVFGYSSGPVS